MSSSSVPSLKNVTNNKNEPFSFLKITVVDRFNHLQVFPSMPPIVFAMIFLLSFIICAAYLSLSLVAIPMWVYLRKYLMNLRNYFLFVFVISNQISKGKSFTDVQLGKSIFTTTGSRETCIKCCI